MSELRKIRRALLSVSDKEGITDFAAKLAGMGVELVSTGGTAKAIKEAGVEVKEVSELTGFPEMMDGRVKTLHPRVHGALLAVRDKDEHVSAMEEHGIEPIDMVVINLYPFEQTIEKEDVTVAEAVEQIDIGGPAMIRSASKNWRDVAVVTDSRLYPDLIAELEKNDGSLSIETRQRLAALAFTRTSHYDLAISSYLADQLGNDDLDYLEPFNPFGNLAFIEIDEMDAFEDEEDADHTGSENAEADGMPDGFGLFLSKTTDLRYGENPHQRSALYTENGGGGLANAEQLQGKEMSFNNYVDAEAAWRLVQDFDHLAVAIIKHTNPSGVGLGKTGLEAYKRALETDPVSAFGGIVAANREIDGATAAEISKIFTEVVIAPSYSGEALEAFSKKKNVRVLRIDGGESEAYEYKQISGGFLVQDQDHLKVKAEDLTVVSKRKPLEEELNAMLLAWTVCKHVKSNAIVFADNRQTIGVGAGQMNRVDSVRIAAMRAERTDLNVAGSVLASDAFFPFRDNVDEAAKFGVRAIIQPGGSMRDEESITAADEHDIAMVFTGYRHFKH